MISYCIVSLRPRYCSLLVADLIRKTTVPFEILLWLNINDPAYETFLQEYIAQGAPIRIIGKTPENIGMQAYYSLFDQARYELIVQIDDDVVAVSRNIAEQAREIFHRFPRVKQLVADVWQDDYTTGARPPLSIYRPYQQDYGLYEGPIDGWFSIFHRSVLPWLPASPRTIYFPLGGLLKNRLKNRGYLGLLCTRCKVFHVVGPQYAAYFGMLDAEIEKYRRLGRTEIVEWYEGARNSLPDRDVLSRRVNGILAALEGYSGDSL